MSKGKDKSVQNMGADVFGLRESGKNNDLTSKIISHFDRGLKARYTHKEDCSIIEIMQDISF